MLDEYKFDLSKAIDQASMNALQQMSERMQSIVRTNMISTTQLLEFSNAVSYAEIFNDFKFHLDIEWMQIVTNAIPLTNISSDMIKTASHVLEGLTESNRQTFLQALENAAPYFRQDEMREYTESIRPKLQGTNQEALTRADWLQIIGILITLMFGIMTLLPDKDEQKIIQQNDVMIEQQKQQLQLQQEEVDALNRLAENFALALEDAQCRLERSDDSAQILDNDVQVIQNVGDAKFQCANSDSDAQEQDALNYLDGNQK